jgi:hypothetical protein
MEEEPKVEPAQESEQDAGKKKRRVPERKKPATRRSNPARSGRKAAKQR